METLSINGAKLHYEQNHDIFAWETNFGDDDLLAFYADDFITGEVKPDSHMVYWYINGMFYETNLKT